MERRSQFVCRAVGHREEPTPASSVIFFGPPAHSGAAHEKSALIVSYCENVRTKSTLVVLSCSLGPTTDHVPRRARSRSDLLSFVPARDAHRGRLQARGTIAVPQHRRRAVTVRSLVLRIPTDLQRITGNATIDAERTDGSNAPCTGTYAIEYVKS